jgi:hypothetical protein
MPNHYRKKISIPKLASEEVANEIRVYGIPPLGARGLAYITL